MSTTPQHPGENNPREDDTRILPAVGAEGDNATPGTGPTQQPTQGSGPAPREGQPPQVHYAPTGGAAGSAGGGVDEEEYYDEFLPTDPPTTVFPPAAPTTGVPPAGATAVTTAQGPYPYAGNGGNGTPPPPQAVAPAQEPARRGTGILLGVLFTVIVLAGAAVAWMLGVFDGGGNTTEDSNQPVPAPVTTSTTTVTTSTTPTSSSTSATSSSSATSTSSSKATSSSVKPSSTSSTTPSSTRPTSTPRTAEPTPAAQPPAGATKCGTGGGFTAYATTDTTSCPFAINTAKAAAGLKDSGGTVEVHSPVTGQDYQVTCSPAGAGRLDCAGGTNARITLIH